MKWTSIGWHSMAGFPQLDIKLEYIANCQISTCNENSDCTHSLCSLDQFNCNDGLCTAIKNRCDGKADCSDSSDKDKCQCNFKDFLFYDFFL